MHLFVFGLVKFLFFISFIFSGRNYGYAKFTSKESANKAIETLHAQEICGNRLKVQLCWCETFRWYKDNSQG